MFAFSQGAAGFQNRATQVQMYQNRIDEENVNDYQDDLHNAADKTTIAQLFELRFQL